MTKILERVREHAENPARKEQERLKAKIYGLASQLDALAERIAELPKTVSPEPIYRQMERIEGLKKEHEAGLLNLAMTGGTARDRIVGLDTFEDFASHYRNFVLKSATVPEQKLMVQKFIRKVEVGTETVRVHYIVDEEHISRELAVREAGSGPLQGKFSGVSLDGCSNTLTFGAHRGGERSSIYVPELESDSRRINNLQRWSVTKSDSGSLCVTAVGGKTVEKITAKPRRLKGVAKFGY